jgi:CPA2 family monovalent cation:H+ antiporter-2
MSVEITAFKETLIVLTTAGVVIPLFKRLRVSPVLGFILVGVLVGPFGLGLSAAFAPWLEPILITDREAIEPIAEIGVALLMFMIGLELSFERLMTMRRMVFGLGGAQVALSALLIGFAALAFGASRETAIVLGLGLALSSTAVVIQSLSDSRRITKPVGRTAFSVLLFQDLAVVPILFIVQMLGARGDAPVLAAIAAALAPAAAAVAAIIVLGRLVLRPLFRMVAGANSPESFMAATLLVVLGASVATASAGLSMAMGALIAGILLAETEYRRQVEVLIDPFKGLFLGVFLISIGMSLDVLGILANPLAFIAAALALIAVKTLIVAGLARGFGVPLGVGLQAGLVLGPGSEFTFVIMGAATALGVVAPEVAAFALAISAGTMALIPLLDRAGGALAKRFAPLREVAPLSLLPDLHEAAPRVLICGFGRVGKTVADMLDVHGIPYLAIDSDAVEVARARKAGRPVAFGDATNIDLLRRCGVDEALALVVTLDAAPRSAAIVEAARAERPNLVIVCRARDEVEAARLYKLGATDAVPETTEASLVLCEQLLADLGVPMGYVIASIHERRADKRAQIQAMAPDATIRKSRLARAPQPEAE